MSGLIPFNKRKDLLSTNFDDFYNMLDDFFTDSWPMKRSLSGDTFKLDVQEDTVNYFIEAELPGIKKEEVSLAIDDGRLTISVNREEKTEDTSKNYIHKERRCCSMQRSIFLNEADDSGIKAKMDNGVLNITVPKKTGTKPLTQIEIE